MGADGDGRELDALDPSARRSPRLRLMVGGAVVLVAAALAAAVVAGLLGAGGTGTTIAPATLPGELSSASSGTPDAATQQPLFVHVLGAVAHPGLYEVDRGARVVDVVAAAGGFADAADPAGVNLARLVADGEQLYVPAVGESVPLAAAPDAAVAGPVNLNSATIEQLDTLPHIGPALAQRILDWREANGGFGDVDDLRSVAGIGEKTFADLEPLVTV